MSKTQHQKKTKSETKLENPKETLHEKKQVKGKSSKFPIPLNLTTDEIKDYAKELSNSHQYANIETGVLAPLSGFGQRCRETKEHKEGEGEGEETIKKEKLKTQQRENLVFVPGLRLFGNIEVIRKKILEWGGNPDDFLNNSYNYKNFKTTLSSQFQKEVELQKNYNKSQPKNTNRFTYII